MFNAIFEFFQTYIFPVTAETPAGDMILVDFVYELMGINIDLSTYFSLICTLISMILILVLCCLFVWKIIKLIGGLFYR